MRAIILAVLLIASAAAEPQIDDADDDGKVPIMDIDDVTLLADDEFLHITMDLSDESPAPGAQACTDQTIDDVPQVGDVPVCVYAGLDLNYQVAFRLEGPDGAVAPEGVTSFETMAWFGNTSAPYAFEFWGLDDAGDLVARDAVEGSAEEAIAWSIPLELLGLQPGPRAEAYVVTDLVAWSAAYMCDGVLFCVPVAEPDEPTDLTFKPIDRAPDEGYGSDYVLPFTPAPAPADESAQDPEPAPEAEPAPEGEPRPEPAPEDPAPQESAPEHTDEAPSDDQKAPGAPLVALLIGLAALGLARRQ